MRVPVLREMNAGGFARQREALGGPLRIALGQQRQIEQPLAGIIDNVQGQGAICAILPLIVDDETEFADVDGRTRPVPLTDQALQMALIGKARHAVVGLRRKMRARDASRGKGLEHREAPATRQPVDQRRDEHGLAGARQAGDAEPQRRIEQTFAKVVQRPRRQPRFLDEVLNTRSHTGAGPGGNGGNVHGKVAFPPANSSFTIRAGLPT